MGKTTDGLVSLAQQIAPTPEPRELDMLLATGEQVTIALLAMALHDLGLKARSFTGVQAGMRTDRAHTKARITQITADRVRAALDAGWVAVVAGFQGASDDDEITTLGRGGSDLTGVALAAALKADVCEIYTDVDGVYTADPNIVPDARKLPRVAYDEMLEMASLGAKVLQARSVEFAKKYGVTVHVRSTFKPDPGTIVTREESAMEEAVVTGVTHDRSQAKISLAARARPSGHRRQRVRRGGRQEHRGGHDRAEHQPRRLHRHLLHACPAAISRGPPPRWRRSPARSARRASSTTSGWPRSRSSASACGATREWRP